MNHSVFRICGKSRFERAMRNQFRCEPQRLVYFLLRRVAHGSLDQRGLRLLGGHAVKVGLHVSGTFLAMVGRGLTICENGPLCENFSAAATGTFRAPRNKARNPAAEKPHQLRRQGIGLDGRNEAAATA